MPGTQRTPAKASEPNKEKSAGRIEKLLSKPWWLGIGAIAAVLAIVIAILPSERHATQNSLTRTVEFSSLSKITIPTFGLVFHYPTGWNQQYLPADGDGAGFVNPNDKAVTIVGYGSFDFVTTLPVPPPRNYPVTIFNIEKEWKSNISSLKNSRILEQTATGATVTGDYPVDAWRVIYRYVNDHGRSMTDMVKATYAEGREVDLVMEAPTTEFQRYKQAFLQLSDKLLLLTKCGDCSAG